MFLGFLDPTHHLFEITILCISVAVFSATFDISEAQASDFTRFRIRSSNSIHVNAIG